MTANSGKLSCVWAVLSDGLWMRTSFGCMSCVWVFLSDVMFCLSIWWNNFLTNYCNIILDLKLKLNNFIQNYHIFVLFISFLVSFHMVQGKDRTTVKKIIFWNLSKLMLSSVMSGTFWLCLCHYNFFPLSFFSCCFLFMCICLPIPKFSPAIFLISLYSPLE